MKCLGLSLSLLVVGVPSLFGQSGDLLTPVQIQCGATPLDVQREGHSAPFVGDFYEDGTLALLVGQYDEGRLRIYRNMGTRTNPKFESFTWFEADGKLARVPEG
jgi:hypothetical protein